MLRGTLRGALGALLAAGALGAAATAADPPPAGPHEEKTDHPDGAQRLDEMKVNLALLSDPVTFPFYLCARADGGALEVGGCVPGEAVRQRALELARRNTSRRVSDRLVVRPDVSPRPPLRAEILQREGSELLAREFGEDGRRLTVEAQPDGLVTVVGPVGSVEEKLAVSRLFRQVPGCTGVVNQLTVRPVLCDGRRVVRVTKDGSQTVPLAALGADADQAAPGPLWTAVLPEAVPQSVRASLSPHGAPSGPEAPAKTRIVADAPAPEATNRPPRPVDALAVPKPPASWGHSDFVLEPGRKTKPVGLTVATMTSVRRTAPRPPAPEVKPAPKEPAPAPAPAAEAGSAGYVLIGDPGAEAKPAAPAGDSVSRPAERPALRSSRAWPPAYDRRAPEPANGRPGFIVFDDEPDPPAPPVTPVTPASHYAPSRPGRPVALLELVRKVNAVCGKQARDVLVEVQRDGGLLVKVKVAPADEKPLVAKILTIPEMASPNVHLAVEVLK